jgi:hypothetical protein
VRLPAELEGALSFWLEPEEYARAREKRALLAEKEKIKERKIKIKR